MAREDPCHRGRRCDLLTVLAGLRAGRRRRADPGAALRLAIGVHRGDHPRDHLVPCPARHQRVAPLHRGKDESGARGCQAQALASARHTATPDCRVARLYRQRSWLLGYDTIFDNLHCKKVPRLVDRRDPLRLGVLPAASCVRIPRDRAG